MDLSQLSDEDLKAIYANDFKKLSDEGLKAVHSQVSQEKVDEQQLAAAEEQKNGPVVPTFSEHPGDYLADKAGDVGTALVGAGQVAMEHPVLTGGAALAAGKVLGNVPYVGPAVTNAANYVANKTIPGYNIAKNTLQGLGNAAAEFAGASKQNTMMDTYKGLQHTASQYVKSGQTVPQGLVDMLKDIEGKLVNQTSSAVNPTTAPKAPTYNVPTANTPNIPPQPMPQAAPIQAAAVAPEAPGVARAAAPVAQAAEQPGMLKNLAQMAGKYGTALAESPLGKTLGGAARIAGSAPVMGAQMALYSGGLNQGENQQMARIRAIQDSIGKMAPAQQSIYFTLPINKQQQVNQMIMNGQDPSGLLVPNAVNSGFSQELNRLGR